MKRLGCFLIILNYVWVIFQVSGEFFCQISSETYLELDIVSLSLLLKDISACTWWLESLCNAPEDAIQKMPYAVTSLLVSVLINHQELHKLCMKVLAVFVKNIPTMVVVIIIIIKI